MGLLTGFVQCHGTNLNVGVGAPTSLNPGNIGDHWWQTDTQADYACTAINPTTWTLITGSAPAANSSFPQGRLSFVSGVPVPIANVTNAGAIYYSPYLGQQVPIAGSPITFANPLPLTLTSTFNSAGNVYDIYVIFTGGALQLVTGPAWSSTTARGTAAALTQVAGIWVNNLGFTGANGATTYNVLAQTATYLGSIYCNANAQVTMNPLPAAAAGGGAVILGLYNAYNRVPITAVNLDSTGNNTVPTINTWSPYEAGVVQNNNAIFWLDGLQQTTVEGEFYVDAQISTSDAGRIGVNIDSPSAQPAIQARHFPVGASQEDVTISAPFATLPLLGLHYAQPMFFATVKATATWGPSGGQQLEAFRMRLAA